MDIDNIINNIQEFPNNFHKATETQIEENSKIKKLDSELTEEERIASQEYAKRVELLDREELLTEIELDGDYYNPDNIYIDGLLLSAKKKDKNNRGSVSYNDLGDSNNTSLIFKYPVYSYDSYINDLKNWRKQIDPFAGQGFFYFKIFFNFETNYGLLGGIKNNMAQYNTAIGYLNSCKDMSIYKSENIEARIESLKRFVNNLSYMSDKTPWIFKQINGLNNIKAALVDDEDFKTKSINIQCSPEMSDMRLGTLFDLYKFACYNNIKNKEIIPKNLRKFEMSILVFHMPLRNYHINYEQEFGTGQLLRNYHVNSDKSMESANLNFNDPSKIKNVMSFKMFTFQNCEFDVNTMNEFASDLNNEFPFNLGNNQITINFDKVYEHRFNEFEYILVGQDGLKNFSENIDDKFSRIAEILKNNYEKPQYSDYADVYENLYGNFTNVHSKYYNDKVKYLKEGTISNGNIYEADYGRINTHTGRENTKYLDEKLNRIKNGGDISNIPDNLSNSNSLKLDWNANIIKSSNNLYNVEGVPSTANTWIGKLLEATYQRAKNAFKI